MKLIECRMFKRGDKTASVLKTKLSKQSGQALTEYAVLVSLVAVACIAAMALFGAALKGRMSSLVTKFP
jgi:Flp pilus assembly pilin Flp